MAEKETGWPADGIYWLRKADYTDIAKVEGRHLTGLQLHGRVEGFIDAGWKFTPASPSDAEQLSELRRLATEARDVLALLVPYGKIHTVNGVCYPDGSHSDAIDRGERVLNQIRDIVGRG